ncbi:MAG: single-stranded DNA-binding protein [Bacteroidales bacterium]|nr:single-stranded DNA-binding protein [Candidatus Scybalousia scybalohippi]
MNKAILVGRLTSEPEVRYSQGENATAIARFTLAVDRKYKKEGQQDADFISCVEFGKMAEFAQKYLHKGMKIAVEGRLQTGSYEKDGQKHYTTDLVIESQEFCEKKSDGNAAPSNDGFMDLPDSIDDQVPFV